MLSPHHRRIFPLSLNEQESPFSPSRNPFFDSIGQTETNDHVSDTWALHLNPKNRRSFGTVALRQRMLIVPHSPRHVVAL
jgi:hypothetical protein